MNEAVDDTDVQSEIRSDRRFLLGVLGVFIAITVLSIGDLLADLNEATSDRHLLLEGAIVLTSLSGVIWIGVRVRKLLEQTRLWRARTHELTARLASSRADADRWRSEVRELTMGLSAAIDGQLLAWGLSPAEKDVALLLLKGLSHKEIADVREVGEATVRQQAHAIYKKAGLGGRADLAAFFLEDLLDRPTLPDHDRAAV